LAEEDEEEPYYSHQVEQIYGPTEECVKTAPYNGLGTWDGTIFGQSLSNYPKGKLNLFSIEQLIIVV
jgi:hypothetical protein